MGPGRAIGADETLDAGLVGWITGHLAEIYAGLSETPADPATTHRLFAEPGESASEDASNQDQFRHRLGRTPDGG